MTAYTILGEEMLRSAKEELLYRQLGAIVSLLTSVRVPSLTGLSDVADRVLPALRMNQVAMAYSPTGQLEAFCTWGFFSEYTMRRIAAGSPLRLLPGQWNDGLHLFIVDFVAPLGAARGLIAVLRDRFPLQKDSVSFARIDRPFRSQAVKTLRLRSALPHVDDLISSPMQ